MRIFILKKPYESKYKLSNTFDVYYDESGKSNREKRVFCNIIVT